MSPIRRWSRRQRRIWPLIMLRRKARRPSRRRSPLQETTTFVVIAVQPQPDPLQLSPIAATACPFDRHITNVSSAYADRRIMPTAA